MTELEAGGRWLGAGWVVADGWMIIGGWIAGGWSESYTKMYGIY